MTHEKYRKLLQKHIAEKYGSTKAAAEAWGCTPGMISHVKTGIRMPTAAMLADTGHKVIMTARFEACKND